MWQKIAKKPELFLVVLMILILAMLIIPLPTWLIDVLLAFNITFSILIFIGIVLYTESVGIFCIAFPFAHYNALSSCVIYQYQSYDTGAG